VCSTSRPVFDRLVNGSARTRRRERSLIDLSEATDTPIRTRRFLWRASGGHAQTAPHKDVPAAPAFRLTGCVACGIRVRSARFHPTLWAARRAASATPPTWSWLTRPVAANESGVLIVCTGLATRARAADTVITGALGVTLFDVVMTKIERVAPP